jgi:tetratricopeptide (TPR) repeat protein
MRHLPRTVLLLSLALLLSCSSEPDEFQLPDGLFDGLPDSCFLDEELRISRQCEPERSSPEPALLLDLELDWIHEQPGRIGEADSMIVERWRAEPERLLWIDTAWRLDLSLRLDSTLLSVLATLPDDAPAKTFAHGLLFASVEESDSLIVDLKVEAVTGQSRFFLLRHQAQALERLGRADEGIALLRGLLPEIWQRGERLLEARLWGELGDRLDRRGKEGDLDAAIQARRRAIEIYQEAGFPHWVLSELVDLADELVSLRMQSKLGDLLTWICDVAPVHRSYYAEMLSLNRLSGLYLDLGETARALRVDQRVLRTYQALGRSAEIAYLHLNIADDYVSLARLDSARVSMDMAFKAAKEHPREHQLWAVYIDDADLSLMEGDYARADSLRMLAAEANLDFSDPRDEHLRLFRRAEHGLVTGKLHLVEETLTELERLKEIGFPIRTGSDLTFDLHLLRARLDLLSGQAFSAQVELDSCRSRLDRQPSSDRSARFLSIRGVLLDAGGDEPGALRHYRSALDSARISGRPAELSRQQLLLGQALLDRGRSEEAREILTRVGSELGAGVGYRMLQERQYWLARCNAASGRRDLAIAELRRLIEREGKGLPRDLLVLVHTELGDLFGSEGRGADAEREYETALMNIEDGHRLLQRPAFRFSAEEVLRRILDSLLTLRLQVDGNPPSMADQRAGLQLHGRIQAILQGCRAPSNTSPRGSTLVQYAGEQEGWIWVMHDGRLDLRITPGREELASLARRVRQGVARPDRPRDRLAEEALAKILLPALNGFWPPGTTLQILPDQVLGGLPWAILPWAAGELIDHGPLVILPNLAEGGAEPRSLVTRPLHCFGSNRPATSGLPDLQHAVAEARDLIRLWPKGQLHIEEEISGEGVLRAGRTKGLLHLAMHTRLGERAPGEMVLALPGGATLQVAGIRAGDWQAELVTLSGCQASGDGLPYLDLAGSFLDAGVGEVLASSLWVPDSAGREFFVAFYTALLTGLPPEQALRRTQLKFRDGPPERAAPYYWAGYRLMRRAH